MGTALDESLLNAMLHGNLEVDSALRELDRGRAYREMIRDRRQREPYTDRRVRIGLRIGKEEIRIVITDEGPGFDPNEIPDPTLPGNMERASGRGLLLINTFMDQVVHNHQGNEITMVKSRQRQSIVAH